MAKTEFQRWLAINPDVKKECKICKKPLGQQSLMLGIEAHHRCIVGHGKKSYNPKAIHAHSPYNYSHQALGTLH